MIESFRKDYAEGIRRTYLIHGVTGSGKTEVYMEMIRQVVDEGKQAIVLIPEIALTYQTVMRFYRRFGESGVNYEFPPLAGERYDQMMRARAGKVDVMIGPRSALFTPFPHLGLIVIDEEHEPTYKSEADAPLPCQGNGNPQGADGECQCCAGERDPFHGSPCTVRGGENMFSLR